MLKILSAESLDSRILEKLTEERSQGSVPNIPCLGETDRLNVSTVRLKPRPSWIVQRPILFFHRSWWTSWVVRWWRKKHREVSWVGKGVSLPFVGSVCVDLELYASVGKRVIRRDVQAMVLSCKSFEFPKLVFAVA
jgi:hypothetical protein